MKRKIRRILPAILAALMIISTLPSDLGFSMTAYAGNSGNDVRIGGSGESVQYNVTVNVTIDGLNKAPVDDQKIEFTGNVNGQALRFDSENNLTATAKFSCTSGDLGKDFKYIITCNNYIITTDKGSTIEGTFKLTEPESGKDVTHTETIDASNWKVTPNFARATTLTLSAEPQTDSAKWGDKVTLTATAKSNSEGGQGCQRTEG